MNKTLLTIVALWLAAALTCPLAAQDETAIDAATLRRTTATVQLGAGPTGVLDTYLSQEKFSGTGFTVLTTSQTLRPGRAWATRWEHQLNFASVDDRSGRREELQGDYTLFAGRLRTLSSSGGWTVEAGGLAALNVGFIYNTANSNNPAQGRLSLTLMPTAVLSRSMHLFNRSLVVRDELNLPLAGMMFSPNYMQSYYEIFSLGNYDHNIVFTTPFSAPTLRNQLTLAYAVHPKTMLTLGWLADWQQAKVNNLRNHVYSQRLMIGVVRSFSVVSHKL